MQKTIYAYKIEIQPVNSSKPFKLESFEDDFIQVVEELCKHNVQDRKYDFRSDKKVIYSDSYEYNSDVGIVKLKFISAKYNARRNVINTQTLKERGILKERGDGDKEKNHICIRFLENNTAVCLSESNYYGIGFGKIIYYLQKKIKDFHKDKKDKCYYNIVYENIVSKDFLQSLAKINKIKAVTLTVDQENVQVSDFKELSGRNDISPDIDILLKPATAGIGIGKDTVKKFFKVYNSNACKVKRVTVEGDGTNKEPLRFDTEQMKQKFIVNVQQTADTGEVDTRSMFDKLFVEIVGI